MLAKPSIWTVLASRPIWVSLLMGFSSGLPLLLTGSLLQAWMTDAKVSLAEISLMSLVGLPYTLKFLWAPLLDRFIPPFLGRRRGWLLLAQLAVLSSLVMLGNTDPASNPWLTASMALLVAFCSATQDIVVDAYRREDLADRELGLGASMYVNGYRIGMLLAGGGGLILADHMPFSAVYTVLAAAMLVGLITTLIAPEPPVPHGTPSTLRGAVVEPLRQYFEREGAWLILIFILLYKLGDTMAGAITTPFYLGLGFSKTEIGAVVKLFGSWATIVGGTLGGLLILRLGIRQSLWWFGLGQMVSTLGFAILANIGHSREALVGVITVENLTSGMGTAAFVAFMGALTDKRFTATQYALLSSLMGIPRVLFAAPTGWISLQTGWPMFFLLCTVIAIPGLLMIRTVAKPESDS
ncbi:AmpG family muropeptide MFS transporter [Parachitinimonas caeni]|uniref:AmpG family muropeptide MFS transporter n=1 Tax=Parachitinimonas caeni TaxID=3031301 RepID=A0ABT7DRU0_9NEIS|nr:AmpG family muropeptide MFS transporter [Parachitinimonas caeni]MDK2122669.1 AmpG family muropeptide MFS transporter [Parachitinimonas caeni]